MPTFRVREHVVETKAGSVYYEVEADTEEEAKEMIARGDVDSIDGEMYSKNYESTIMECEIIGG